MAFELHLYTTSDDPKVVSKELNEIGVATIVPTQNFDVIHPLFIIDYKENYLTANYCYCPLLKRYYFINGYNLDIGKKIILDCSIDVLKTYDEQIRNCTACVTRSESVGGPTYVVDDRLPVNPEIKEMKTIKFENGTLHSEILTNSINNILLTTQNWDQFKIEEIEGEEP